MRNRELENLKKRAYRELSKLKKECTNLEWNKLVNLVNQNKLDGSHTDHCVYGLMTGNCHSERAIDLINSCSIKPYFDSPNTREANKEVLQAVNGKAINYRNYTALESVLYYDEKWVKNKIIKLNEEQ